ncbi:MULTISPECIES: aldehyde dehydrogenase family protein [Oceanobacillus]|uniref:Aldehyde dehydrogenase n=1 Tax=Oceanobacillus kimchii TaxID=746691 RepID=A0ABQ5TP58_9BACI|nr:MULTISPECIES: aldehyde dehydrogenase family protein [Oceanobacillus]MBT2600509.1 aldehyde dehydrogenase family protein [Oceanobacillus sp. ISL-74]MBT2650667.1 aldehyde dehydrogenase family protein [Oceanobacillus sp. ISL-73]OEH54791.1 aldehyde dehydrogenase [Oceanobacillus sp. E9]GLO67559.1 aldehyde dehydrogenase [Oceanobacillus kimchii]
MIAMEVKQHQFFINGEWIEGEEHYDLIAPYNKEVIAHIPLADEDTVEKAVASAKAATDKMKKLTLLERSTILEKVVAIFTEKQEECAKILAFENAKPIQMARGEIQRTIETYKFAAEEAKKIAGEVIPMDAAKNGAGRFGFTKKEPLGVIAAITPFNFPFNLVAHKLGPAFAMGNTVVLKPASQTPLSAIMTAKIFEEAGLPEGALNLVFGSGRTVGDALVTHEDIKMVTFTGSVPVGKGIREKAGLKRVTLELGSNSAVILDHADDLAEVAAKCANGAFSYSGQTCISVQRVYVKDKFYDAFMDALTKEVEDIKVGNPLNEDTVVSALIHEQEAERVEKWIQEVSKEQVARGGERSGSVIQPTVLTNIDSHFSVIRDEAFAPIMVVNKYETWEEAVELVNDSQYGLQAGVFTDSLQKAFQAVDDLEVGGVIINDIPTYRVDHMPYGGVKNSGTGREGIRFSMDEMSELKLGVMNLN